MAIVTEAPKLVTTEEFLALPDDGVERELINGVLREYPEHESDHGFSMTVRNRVHARIETRVARFLDIWLDGQSGLRGQVVSGEAGFRLRRDPDTIVGVDVAYVSHAVVAASIACDDFVFFEGTPVLAVEILSPSDSHKRVHEKVDLYLDSGVAIVWLIDPKSRTLTIFRPDAEPEMVNVLGELTAEPELPGFRVAAAELFA